jgi:hypothetical protein
VNVEEIVKALSDISPRPTRINGTRQYAQLDDEPKTNRFILNHKALPPQYPTNMHGAEFWEALGRAVATFGFLEEVLGKAIFSFTATGRIPEEKIEEEFEK